MGVRISKGFGNTAVRNGIKVKDPPLQSFPPFVRSA